MKAFLDRSIRKLVSRIPVKPYILEKILNLVKPVLSDHIKQDIFLAFQTGDCLLLHESGAESST